VAVLNDGRYGHGVQDGGVRVSLLRAAKYPDPVQDHGRHQVTIAVLPHAAGLHAVVREAEAMNLPLRVVAVGAAAELSSPVVTIDGEGVELSAVKRADDGSGDLIVRLSESLGARTNVSVRLPHRIAQASFCNLLEEPADSLETSDGIAAFTLAPFQLVTLRLA
jgi:alpha-mannosidase